MLHTDLIGCCSMAGHRTLNNKMNSFYGATKYAVRALTEGVRTELRGLKSHIRVTVSTAADTSLTIVVSRLLRKFRHAVNKMAA